MPAQLKSNTEEPEPPCRPVKSRRRAFLIGLVVGLVLPRVLGAVCSFLLIGDTMGWNRFGAVSRAMKEMEKGDYEQAVRWANRAIQFSPECTMGYRARGEAQELAGNLEKAVADYTIVLAYDEDTNEDTNWVYVDRAHVFEKLGMRSRSAIDYSRYIVSHHDRSPDELAEWLEFALDRRPVFGQEPVRSLDDLAQFLDECDAHTKQLSVVRKASEISRNAKAASLK